MIKYDWSKYNLKRDTEAISQFKKYSKNKKRSIIIQKGLYNHIRDIYALTVLISKKTKKNLNILDYGGNLISNISLSFKIDTNKINVWVYNPFSSNLIYKKKILRYVNVIKSLKLIKKNFFSITYLGSVIQYCKNLDSIEGREIINNCKYVLLTHTPISIKKREFYLKQINHKNLYQKIHSLQNIKKKLLKNNYSVEFISYNDFKYTGLKKNKNILSANILFKKKSKII